jgi:putative DNA primase/helicase
LKASGASRGSPARRAERELDAALDVLHDVRPKANGGYTACCAAHDDHDPSLSINVGNNGRLLFYCFAGCAFVDIVNAIKERQATERSKSCNGPRTGCNGSRFRDPKQVSSYAHKRCNGVTDHLGGSLALRIWRGALPAKQTLVETYLRARGISIPVPECLRFYEWLKHPDGRYMPAMVAAVTNVSGDLTAVHRTFLKPHLETAKLMLGPCAGGAVRLAPAAAKIGVAEGIETALSVMQIAKLPTWAAMSTSGMVAIALPHEVREVVSAADGDEPGRKAARALAARLIREGRIARITETPGGKDFNDFCGGRDERATQRSPDDHRRRARI